MIEVSYTQETFDALERDAERYRKLRLMDWFSSDYCVVMNPKQAVRPGHDCPSHSRLDKLVDTGSPE